MVRVPSAESGKEADRREDGSQSQPAMAKRNGGKRQVFAVGELPEDIAQAVRGSEMDARHAPLDDLIKDWKP